MRGSDAGSEEFKIEKTEEGYRLTGITRFSQSGGQIEMAQSQSLDKNWNLVRYRLEASVGGRKQVIEAWREADLLQMRASIGEASKAQSVPAHGFPLVFDNLIVAHFQVFLNAIKNSRPGFGEWQLLVPQRLASINGKLEGPLDDAGILDGKPVRLRKYTLELANVLEEFWAEKDSNRLMRVTVPLQNVEYIRNGFSLQGSQGEALKPEQGFEEQVTFQSGSLRVPGTLFLPPKNSGRFPILVLVHGSGPNDRDETIGPNKPFRDIAYAMGSAGIATLRYDKRTFAFKNQIDLKTFTLDQEVTDDAVAALEYCLTRQEIDPEKIFLLGHSLGATMVPYIAGRFSRLRGAILLAGAARSLDELIIEQTAFQSRRAGTPDAQVSESSEELKKAFARVRSGEAADNEMVFFAPARYWREIFKLNVPRAFSELKVPVLALQGGKDVQVRRQDFELIKNALTSSGIKNHEFEYFPELNHLFMEVSGDPSGAEYGRPGKVHKAVVDRISAWVMRISQGK